ncbi:hypothetical protein [Natronococcus sp. A-GB7]|uniref:hypothetical protein n=1 Tax=Natronococcus sp. A-GB7 TaxID=3037649 RepID=UPI00241DE6E4|nr:hypothetical protein [Natronococcus sp. A-GB7]MDG5818235.1 hypothetical protein [Natronococcus sp. A-GB7]
MTEQSSDGPTRLRKSGVGVVLGGVLLAVTAAGLPDVGAAALVAVLGLGGLVYGDDADVVQGSVGVLAVGAIGLVEAASGVGLGLEPTVLGGIAVAFGVLDVLAGVLLRRLSSSS